MRSSFLAWGGTFWRLPLSQNATETEQISNARTRGAFPRGILPSRQDRMVWPPGRWVFGFIVVSGRIGNGRLDVQNVDFGWFRPACGLEVPPQVFTPGTEA